MQKQSLSEKSCAPCKGGIPAMQKSEAETLKAQLKDGWVFNDLMHLNKSFKFKNFVAAMDFANKVALVAEQEKHHPNLVISWGQCEVEIWTHAVNGLSENDFILAAKIDNI